MISINWKGAMLLFLAVVGCGVAQENRSGGAGNPPEPENGAPETPVPELTVPESYAASVAAWYRGEHEAARAGLRRLLTADPENPTLRRDLLLLLREAGEYREAAAVARELPRSDPEAPLTLLLAGELDALSGRPIPPPPENREIAGRQRLLEAAGALLLGRRELAAERIDLALERVDHLPYAYLLKGVIEKERQRPAAAVTLFEEALRQDRNLTEALLPLAEAKHAIGEEAEAYRILRRAEVALPWNEEIAALRAAWEEKKPALAEREAAELAERRATVTPPRAPVWIAKREAIPRLRVGLAEELSSIFIKPGGPFRMYTVPRGIADLEPEDRPRREAEFLAGTPIYAAEEPFLLRFRMIDGVLQVSREAGETGELLFTTGDPVRLVYREPETTTTLFDLTYGAGRFYGGREDRSYRGDIEAIPRGERFTVVNELNVEEYLYSVVPSEMPAYWPEEALKSQAVAARSYTLRRRPRFRSRGFDLLSSVTSAHYRGVTGEDPRTTAAVRATGGEVLTAGNRILDAVYSANSAGYTESSESVWGGRTPLVGVSDPKLPELTALRPPTELYDWILRRPESYSGDPAYASASAYRWKRLVPREEIELQLRRRGEEIGTLTAVIPGARGLSGRVESVRFIGSSGETVVERDAIRSALGGLRSNLFIHAHRYGDDGELEEILFEGAGWGHGVGLCQTGAAGMAADGWAAEEILSHYYPEATLSRMYEVRE